MPNGLGYMVKLIYSIKGVKCLHTYDTVSLAFLFRPDDISYFPHHSVEVRDDFLYGIKFERQEDRILIRRKHCHADERFFRIFAAFVNRHVQQG